MESGTIWFDLFEGCNAGRQLEVGQTRGLIVSRLKSDWIHFFNFLSNFVIILKTAPGNRRPFWLILIIFFRIGSTPVMKRCDFFIKKRVF